MKTTLIIIAHLFMISLVSAQTEQFDIATFTAPQGWQRSSTNGTLVFMDSKTENDLTSFCQIILYPSSNDAGSADKNLKLPGKTLWPFPPNQKLNL